MIMASCAGLILAQDVIALKNGERIENVTVSSITDKTIIYLSEGNEVNIPRNSADAILYADGRYEEIKHSDDAAFFYQNEYFLPSAEVTDGLVILGLFVDMSNIAYVKGAQQKMDYYCLCIEKNDMSAYKLFLKEHKEIKKKYNSVFKDSRNYEAAQQASRAYKKMK